MRHDSTDTRVRRGYGIIIGAALVAALLFNIDTIADLFRDRVEVVALVHETSGVRTGSPVVVAGVEVGHVTDVGVAATTEGAVGLELRIDRGAGAVVRRGSLARTTNRRFVGEPVVLLTAGPTDAPPIGPGDTLGPAESVSIASLAERGRSFPARLDSLRGALAGIRELAAGSRFGHLAGRAETVADEAAELSAFLGRSEIADRGPALATRLQSLRERVTELADAAGDIEELAGDDALRGTSRRIASRARRIETRLERLEGRARRGTLGRLQRDRALAEAVAGVTAQIDSLTADGLGFALRMLAP